VLTDELCRVQEVGTGCCGGRLHVMLGKAE